MGWSHIEPLPGAGQRLFVVIAALGTGILYAHYGWTLLFWKACVLFAACLYLSLQDVFFGVLPDRIVFPLAIVGVLCSVFDGGIGFEDSLFGGIVGGGVLLFLRVVSKKGVGLGDVKFSLALGLWLGACNVAVALWLSYMLGGLWALYRLVRGARRKDVIPFGPFLSVSSISVFVWQDAVCLWIGWWMH